MIGPERALELAKIPPDEIVAVHLLSAAGVYRQVCEHSMMKPEWHAPYLHCASVLESFASALMHSVKARRRKAR